jgi:hypothetical protein
LSYKNLAVKFYFVKPHRTEGKQTSNDKRKEFVENLDYYFENGLMVLTAHFLRERGYCCGNGCRHCPYQSDRTTEKKPTPISQRTQ